MTNGAGEVAVETNWILDVALHQDQASEELLTYTEQRHVRLFLPSFCIAEAIKAFESRRQDWEDLERRIRAGRREILRSSSLQFPDGALGAAADVLAQVADVAEQEFWRMLERIAAVTDLLEPTPELVALTADLRQFLDLEPADAAILAHVVIARRADVCRSFMSRDEHFRNDVTRAWMTREGIEFFDSPYPVIGPIRARLGRGEG